MMNKPSGVVARYRIVALVVFVAIAVWAFVSPHLTSTAAESSAETEQQGRFPRGQRRGAQNVNRAPRVDYAKFSHRTKEHQKSCSECHKFPSRNWKEVRKGNAAFPDVTEFPEHASCLGCHREQFFARERPAPRICSNCHVQISPRNTVRFPFPSISGFIENPARGQDPVSDFGVQFPHDKHVDIVGWNRPDLPRESGISFVNAMFGLKSTTQGQEKEPKSCAVCHQTYQPQGKSNEEFMTKRPKDLPEDAFWLKKGTFKTTPMNHETCFTCHSTDTGIEPAPSSCNVCHKLKMSEQTLRTDFDAKLATTMGITDRIILSHWRRRESAGAFRHEAHQDQNCLTCHSVSTMNTMDAKTLKVRVQSCGGEGCHITPTTDDGGILNFEVDQRKAKPAFQCTKCHIIFGKEPVPGTHLNAISALNKK
jgi:hypothetical protein